MDEILDITRISENRLRLHREKVQLNSLLTDIICDTEPQFQARGITFLGEICPEAIVVNADALRLTQCMVNHLG